jgi:UDPglucose 6-dehydrogenase
MGTGYVGLVTATCFADAGHDVVGVDSDEKKVALLRNGAPTFYEPELEDLLRRAIENKTLRFTGDVREGVREAEVVFVCVGTPSGPDGTPDLSAVTSCVREAVACAGEGTVIVVKSTVPVGTNDSLAAEFATAAGRGIELASNPEFLKEGAAVEDFLKPDRVVIGVRARRAGEILRELYEPFVRTGAPIIQTDTRSAEMGKYAANGMLACRISFMNEAARLCDAVGADVESVRRIVGSDKRVGGSFLFPGPGYGGSCFPKDVRALAALGAAASVRVPLIEAVDATNAIQRSYLVEVARRVLGCDLSSTTFGIWGLAFKPRTDDVRESPALDVVRELLAAGARVRTFDPAAMATAKAALGASGKGVCWAKDRYDAASGADALVLVTEWPEFRRPDPRRLAREMRGRTVIDGRNVMDGAALGRAGFTVCSIGRPVTKPN